MCNDFSNGFRDSAPSADSGLKVRISSECSEHVSSVVDRERRLSESERLDEILPGLMADIDKRKEIANCSLLHITECESVREVKNVPASSIAASREAYHTIGVPGWQKHCRSWKNNDGCPWRVNDKTTFR